MKKDAVLFLKVAYVDGCPSWTSKPSFRLECFGDYFQLIFRRHFMKNTALAGGISHKVSMAISVATAVCIAEIQNFLNTNTSR